MPITSGPYLVAAFFCEKILREQDGVLSAIRIVDRWTVNGPTEMMPPTVIQAFIRVLLKSGIYRGNAQLAITPISPSNTRMQPIVFPLYFEADDDRGTGIVLPLGFPVQESDVYWFEVALAKQSLPPEVVTCIPMRVVYLRLGTATPAPPTPPN